MAQCTRQLGEMPPVVWQPVPTATKGFDTAAKRQVAVKVMEEEQPKKSQSRTRSSCAHCPHCERHCAEEELVGSDVGLPKGSVYQIIGHLGLGK